MDITDNGLSRREKERLTRQAAILNAAKELFAEKGFAGATLEEIAMRAEFGKGTLYNYFPDGKEQILLAIFDQLYNGLCSLIEESFGSQEKDSFRVSLEEFVSNCFLFFNDQFNLFIILVKEAEQLIFSDDEERVAYFVKQQNRVLQTLAEPLQDAMDRGDIREMSPEQLANLILVNIKGYQMRHCPRNLTQSKRPLELPSKEQAGFLTDFLLYGVSSEKTVEVASQ
ncbi:MAG: TetR/AcrR family transcriptional regulator [Bacteroidetes bacterium]|nr:MAG: TetR/AcrR family transcriptional regulator [Bacteroidota bacterium]